MDVKWMPVVGYEDYFLVSDRGDVFSLRTNKLIKQVIPKSGYCIFTTRFGGRRGVLKCFRVHRLVAEAFIPNPENKPQVNHKNCCRSDNVVTNLEWVTPKENSEHAIKMGRCVIHQGQDRVNSKLTDDSVRYIRNNYIPRDRKFGARALGREFGVDKVTILGVVEGITWKHIK